MSTFCDDLAWRGALQDASDGARDALGSGSVTAYIGFDPTASSLHVGSLLQMVTLARLQRHGHTPIALVGGGTGMIGDPSGKSAERTLQTPEQIEANLAGIKPQLARVLDFDVATNPARLVNNADWLSSLGAMAFLRDIGKHFTVNYMLAKESVKRRVESEDGISYTEFSYLLLQAYDFLEVFDRFGCTVQIGGSDQWGNITAGIDLIRRLRGARAYGLVTPLVTTASGTKFGKTEAGTIWLDPERTRPFEFYQFWLNIDDRDAVRYLKFFTFLDAAQIESLADASRDYPERRIAQRELAREVTRLVHGDQAVREAETATEKLFGSDLTTMSVQELLQVFPNVPSSTVTLTDEGWPVTDLLMIAGATASRSEATRLVRGGGVYVNDRRVSNEKERLLPSHAIEGQLFVVRKGKKDNFLVRILRDA